MKRKRKKEKTELKQEYPWEMKIGIFGMTRNNKVVAKKYPNQNQKRR